jgi:hypothetical protein
MCTGLDVGPTGARLGGLLRLNIDHISSQPGYSQLTVVVDLTADMQ